MKEDNFFQIDSLGLDFLQEQWQLLMVRYCVNSDLSEKYFFEIKEKYSEKKRFYHNLTHIQALLKFIETLKEKIQDYQSVSLAIWFHDLIYNTKRNNNEEKSAEFAVKALQEMKIPADIIRLVELMILATKTHDAKALTEDGKLFLDLDLAILGSKAEIYQQYYKAIRKEYSWVPWFLYRHSRKKVLNSFLGRQHIFFTQEMSQLEGLARKNITQEIEFLSK